MFKLSAGNFQLKSTPQSACYTFDSQTYTYFKTESNSNFATLSRNLGMFVLLLPREIRIYYIYRWNNSKITNLRKKYYLNNNVNVSI